MGKRSELAGERFGRLVVREYSHSNKDKRACWTCDCDCGGIAVSTTANLKQGFSTSCGCSHKEKLLERSTTHGLSARRIYNIWSGLKNRCECVHNTAYKYYGGRGITYAKEWKLFENFFRDMKDGYSDDLSIDRIDVNGNYCKENCRWATDKEQANNKRNTGGMKNSKGVL